MIAKVTLDANENKSHLFPVEIHTNYKILSFKDYF